MANITVLGSGMVGRAISLDLAENHSVTATDLSQQPLINIKKRNSSIHTIQLDVSDLDKLESSVKDADVVVLAVPGFLGFNTLKAVLELGKNVVDISFFPENALELNDLATERGVAAVVDCGVAPGMDNIILGYYDTIMMVKRFECLVGGLPFKKTWPFMYKAPFSPIDVIEEYTRPARYIENGQMVVREPLTDRELIEFDKIGTLESFNSDGLRSLILTHGHIQNMKEKTLRYPGHAEYISVFKEAGFFDSTPINLKGQMVSPLDMTSQMLFKSWKLEANEPEFTVMRVTVEGTDMEGAYVTIQYNLFDEYNQETGISSMARTTGYTATATVNAFLEGLITDKGVLPPEIISKYKPCFDYILNYQKERGINYIMTSQTRTDT